MDYSPDLHQIEYRQLSVPKTFSTIAYISKSWKVFIRSKIGYLRKSSSSRNR